MMKRLFFFLLVTFSSLAAVATDSVTVKALFKEMPDSVIPYLSKNNRLDFIDFMESNMKAEVTNAFGGKSVMTALTDDYINIRLNEVCQLEILLLTTAQTANDQSKVIALIRTVGRENDVLESESPQFYTLDWKPLTASPLLTEADRSRLDSHIKPLKIFNLKTDTTN